MSSQPSPLSPSTPSAPDASADASAPIAVDALIVGAGPVGLFAAFQFGLLGMRCAIVDALPFAGGQTVQLYADKPIYDIPGIPVCTGRELTAQLLTQIQPFGHALHLGFQVASLQVAGLQAAGLQGAGLQAVDAQMAGAPVADSPVAGAPLIVQASKLATSAAAATHHQAVSNATAEKTSGETRYCLHTSPSHAPTQAGPSFLARFVCITAGVGAFVPKPLPGLAPELLAPFDGHSVHWHLAQARDLPGGPHLIAGGGPEAVQAALHLAQAQPGAAITLVHRRDAFQAEAADLAALNDLRAQGRVQVLAGQITALHAQAGDATGDAQAGDAHALHSVSVATPDGPTQPLPAAQLWVLQGLSPRLGALADWGMQLARRQIAVDPATMATSLPGVFAAGDVVSLPGKRRLIISGFHEATQAAYAASDLLLGGDTPVQYTTTSPQLHTRLGVNHDLA